MIIGDWEIIQTSERDIQISAPNTKLVTQNYREFDFTHLPTKFKINRGIHFIVKHDEAKRLEVLTDLIGKMKIAMVDPLFPVQEQNNDQQNS